nr:PREDICTED: uncharacterized protein LOC103999660 isoform X1 [Musa acuminata subsp. malaccensis]
MWARPPYAKGGGGVEAGIRALYPVMLEPPELRWSFIRKIYSILSAQMLITVAVAAAVVSIHPVSHFFVSSSAGLGLYVFLIILPFFVICPLYYYYQHYPLNYLLLGIFTVSLGFAVGLTCAFTSGWIDIFTMFLFPRSKTMLSRSWSSLGVEKMDACSSIEQPYMLLTFVCREGYSRICRPHGAGRRESHDLHLLGCGEGLRLHLPRPFLVLFHHDTLRVRSHPGVVSCGKDLRHDLRRVGRHHLLWLHRLRYR